MSAETEVGRLLVRLVGDGGDYQQMLEQVIKATEGTQAVTKAMAEEVTKAAAEVEKKTAVDVKLEEIDKKLTETEKELAEIEKERQKLMEEGERVTRSVMNATEKYDEEMEKLVNLYSQGAISAETFNRASDRAYNQFIQGSNAAGEYGQKIIVLGAALTGLGAAITAAFGGLGYKALGEFEVMESGMLKLEAAIKANGREVERTMNSYTVFASEIQNATRIGDDNVLALLQEAESMGLTGEAAKRAAKNAISLGAAKGMAASSAIRMTVALEQGRSEMLGRFLPALRDIKDETERTAKAQELIGNMFAVAEADAASFAGQMDQLNNSFGDFLEEIGAVLASMLKPFVAFLKELVTQFQELHSSTKTIIAVVIALGTGLGIVITTIGGVVIAVGTLITAYGTFITTLAGSGPIIAAFGTALNLALGPVGAITLAVGALSAALLYYQGVKQDAIDAELLASQTEGNRLEKELQNVRRRVDAERARMGVGPKFSDADKGINRPQKEEEVYDVGKVEELTKAYQEQLQVFGMTQRQAEIHRLEMAGVNEVFLKGLRDIDAALSQAEEAQKAAQAAEEKRAERQAEANRLMTESRTPLEQYQEQVNKLKGFLAEGLITQEAYNHHLKQANDEFARLSKTADQVRADKIIEQFATPLQKFKKTFDELNELKGKGLLDQGTFKRAIDNAREEYEKLTEDKEVKIKLSFSGIEAVEAGTAEAMARIAEFEHLKVRGGGSKKEDPVALLQQQEMVAEMARRKAGNPMRDTEERKRQYESEQSAIGAAHARSFDRMNSSLEKIAGFMEKQAEKEPITVEPLGLN